MYMNS